ncbi:MULTISPECIES: A24 family peptidase [unclassified Streptomyces]|uniref:prepilin peptidase n=1 Tax=unclassified Streptomyces TaxID=2593676 RepID=UPI000805FA8F|nr:A24 family peptidase [Streptomyces sp. OspMP-M45]MYR74871.1 prepilin peptidase [Streptomyces sp. SID4925]SBU90511.1 leader peptidase (prepilin peptidase) / N-methyltransferase [Streptomyces sp. OspMP-M45]
MDATLIAVAGFWGAATGLLLPRAAYRFSVEPEEPWRDACPAGHALTGPGRGWIGPAVCASCAVPARPGGTAPQPGTDTVVPAGPEPAPETVAPAEPEPGTDTGTSPDLAPGPDTAVPAGRPRYAPGVLAPAVTVLACALLAWAVGSRPELAVWLAAAPVAVLLCVVDRRVHRLPDALTLPLAAAVALLLGGVALLPGRTGSWTTALLGGAALGGFYFLLFLINPDGMGFGDVKLALALGVALGWYGWAVLCAGGFAGFLFGAVYGLGLLLLRRAGRKTGIPFGPFMIAGALLGLVLGGLSA